MGAGCSSDKSADNAYPNEARSKSTTMMKSGSGGTSRRTREDLASQFVAEFPADDDPDEVPSYPEGSREATMLKIFDLLDKENTGFVQVPVWKDYVLQAGLTTEALGKELAVIVANQSARGDPRVSAQQFVTAMIHMVAEYDDHAFGQFVAQTLMAYRAKGASKVYTEDQVESWQVASQA